ncbi:hypothetical protein L218DRAFT_1078395 [Marasmius fiardii PR-910]|nr:hypothetical protein L218DRAFT_1078395 [Marasmius fiardii PR-910]
MEVSAEKTQSAHNVPGSPVPSPKTPMKTSSVPQQEPKVERESPPPPSSLTTKPTTLTLSENLNPRKRKSHPDETEEQQQHRVQVKITEDDDADGDVDAEGDEVNEDDGVEGEVTGPDGGSLSPPPSSRIDLRLPSLSTKIVKGSSTPGGKETLPYSGSEYESGRIKCDACGTHVPFRDPETGHLSLDHWNKHKLTCTSAAGSMLLPKGNHQVHHHPHQSRSNAPGSHSIPIATSVRSSRHHDHHPSDTRKHLTSQSPPPHGAYHHLVHPHSHSQPPHPHHQQHPHNARMTHVSSNGGEREPVIYTPESTASALAHPPPKRRRAKRTEEERINYLRSDPYVAQFEAYRVLCASCDKWIRLRPNSTYCSIPWDAHRKSCLAKKISSKNTYALEERNSLFSKDPDVRKFDAERVLCSECDQWIAINPEDHLQAVQKWLSHKSSCQKATGRNAYTGGQHTLSPELLPQAAPSSSHARPSNQHPPHVSTSPHISRSQPPPFPPRPTSSISPSVSHPSLAHPVPPPKEIQLAKEAFLRRRASVSGAASVGVTSSGTVPVMTRSPLDDATRAFPGGERHEKSDRDNNAHKRFSHSHSGQQSPHSHASLSRSPTPPENGDKHARHHSEPTVIIGGDKSNSVSRRSPGDDDDVKMSVEAHEENRDREGRKGSLSLSPRVSTATACSSSSARGPPGSGGLSTAAQESRRRNAEQRAATLRADPLIEEVEPNRVFCSLCQKWVQLRQDSSYCAYPWLQHKGKCLVRYERRAQKAEEIADFKRRREAMRTASSSSRRHESYHPPYPPPHIRHSTHAPPHPHLRGYSTSGPLSPPYGEPGHYDEDDDQGSVASSAASTDSGTIPDLPVVSDFDDFLSKKSEGSTLRGRRHETEYAYLSENGYGLTSSIHGHSSTKQRGMKHLPHVGFYRRGLPKLENDDERGLRFGMGVEGDVGRHVDGEGDPDGLEGEGERTVVDGDGDVEMMNGEKGSQVKGGKSTKRPAPSRRSSGHPYLARQPLPSPPPHSASRRTYGGGRGAAQVAVPAVSGFVPPQLADLDSPGGRKHFVFSSITYLFQTTYETTDDMTISSLLTYLNAAMPPDKHEEFDTAEVAKAVVASGDRGRYVLEGDLVRRI